MLAYIPVSDASGIPPVSYLLSLSLSLSLCVPFSLFLSQVGLAVQGASLVGMFLVNAVMISTFIKALQMSGSTVATVTNFATNFLLSVSDHDVWLSGCLAAS